MSYLIMIVWYADRKLTHGGDVIRRSKSGRITEQWDGVVAELSSKLLNSGHNLINRGGNVV